MSLTIQGLLELMKAGHRREEELSSFISKQSLTIEAQDTKIADLTRELSFVSNRYHSVLNTLRTAEDDLNTFLRNQG